MISIIHPSRGRPEMAEATINEWLSKCDFRHDVEYILSIDATDDKGPEYVKVAERTGVELFVRWNKTAIEAINTAAKKIKGELIIVVSDDFSCPNGWDTSLGQMINYDDDQNFKPSRDFVIKTKDGIQPTLITLPILDIEYYNRFGYIYFEGYSHLFCDQEMTAVGHMLGRVLSFDLEFKHNHYTVGGMKKDAINIKNDATWQQGERLFNERLKSNFGIEKPVIPYSEIKWR